MKLLITGACGHIGSYVAEHIHKIKEIQQPNPGNTGQKECNTSPLPSRKNHSVRRHFVASKAHATAAA